MRKKPIVSSKKIIALSLAAMMLATPILAQQAPSDYVQGKTDGARDGNAAASPLWFAAGVGCGCFGAGAAYLMPPSVPAERLVGKSADYATGYAEAYRSAGRNRQTLYACTGWLTWGLIYLAIGPSIW